MTLPVTDRELATILAALGSWQHDLADHEDEEARNAHPFDPTTIPLCTFADLSEQKDTRRALSGG